MNTLLNRRRLLAAGAGLGASLLGAPGIGQATTKADVPPAKFKLGIVTYNIAATWDVPTILKVCKAVGLAAVELRTTHKHGVEPSLSPESRAEVRKQFTDANIAIWGLGSVCEFHAPDMAVVQKNIETCKQFLQLAADLGGKGVKVRPNGLPKDVPVEKTLEQIGKALIPCGKTAASLGLEVWVEVHGGGTSHPPHMKSIMEHCGLPNVGVTWNSNNTDVKDGSLRSYFDLLKPWIKSCHINDLVTGYPYRELFTCLREMAYDRVTLIEVGKGMPDVDSGERFLRYYKALWTELCRGG